MITLDTTYYNNPWRLKAGWSPLAMCCGIDIPVVTDLHYCVSTYSSRTRHTPPSTDVPQEKSSRGGLFTAAENTLRHPMQPHIAPGIASTAEL